MNEWNKIHRNKVHGFMNEIKFIVNELMKSNPELMNEWNKIHRNKIHGFMNEMKFIVNEWMK